MGKLNKEEILKLLFDKLNDLYANDCWIDFSTTDDNKFTIEMDKIKIRKFFSDYKPIIEIRINDKTFLTTKNNSDIKIEDLIDLLKHIQHLYENQFIKYLKDTRK